MLFENIRQKKEILPLTDLQKKMYASVNLRKYDYVISVKLQLKHPIDIDIMESAVLRLMDNQQTLRAVFMNTVQKGPLQIILSEYTAPFYFDNEVPEITIDKEPWNLVWKSSDYTLTLNYYHIVMDGWGMGIFWKELFSIYKAMSRSIEPIIDTSYPIRTYQKMIENKKVDSLEQSFWDSVIPEGSCMLSDCLRPLSISDANDTIENNFVISLSEDLQRRIISFSSEQHITQAVVFYAAWMILLYGFTGNDKISESLILSGRNLMTGWDNTIGMFIQSVVFSDIMPKTFTELCNHIRTFLSRDYVQSYCAGHECNKAILRKGKTFICDSMVVVENYPLDRSILNDDALGINSYEYNENPSYPFSVIITMDNPIKISISSSEKKYFHSLPIIAKTFKKILEQIGNGVNNISEIAFTDQKDIFCRWGNNDDSMLNNNLADIIMNGCRKYRDNDALVYEDSVLTYGDLYSRVLSLSSGLQKRGVKKGDFVGIAIPRSMDQLLAVYAVIMSGAVYVPFSDIPVNRANYMITQAGIDKIIALKPKDGWKCRWLLFDELSDKEEAYKPVDISSDNTAYVLFTSGSTGNPKGCTISNKAIINRIAWNNRELAVNKKIRQIFKTPVSFDVSLIEIFSIFFSGHSLYILPSGEESHPDHVLNFIDKNRINYAHFVPSMLNTVLQYAKAFECVEKLRSLRILVCSGEILHSKLVRDTLSLLKKHDLRMVNLYGPTETAVDVSYYDCDSDNELFETPIGKPVDNTGLLILNQHMKELPIGVEGELYILGCNVGKGYINDAERTAENFIEIDGIPAFRTGDLAYRLKTGDLVVTGRIDGQVKYNGVRIETSEIEHHIVKSGYYMDAYVFVEKDENGSRLIACCCGTSENKALLCEYLKTELPTNMMPSDYYFVSEFPVSAHGKTNHQKLKDEYYKRVSVRKEIIVKSDIEREISDIWNRILNKNIEYSPDSSFFAVGGDSVLLITLLVEIKKKWGVRLDSSSIYEKPTIREIGNKIVACLKSDNKNEIHVLDTASKKSIFLSQINNPDSTAYNMPILMELTAHISSDMAEEALIKVINHYEWLHKRYKMDDGGLYEYTEITEAVPTEAIDCSEEEIDDYVKKLIQPFDMKASLFRFSKINRGVKQYLFVDFHHILCDQSVVRFLIDSWLNILEGKQLEKAELVADEYLRQTEISEQENYWDDKWPDGGWHAFKDRSSLTDKPLGDLARYTFNIDSDTISRIDQVAKENDCSKFQLLIAVFGIFCIKAFNVDRLSLGTNTVAGDLSHQNMQLQVLVLGITEQICQDFKVLLRFISKELAEGMKYGGTTVDGLFDVMFIKEENLFEDERLNHYAENIRFVEHQTKNPLTLFYKEQNDGISFCFDYDKAMFEREAIMIFAESFCCLLNDVLESDLQKKHTYRTMTVMRKNHLMRYYKGHKYENDDISIQEKFVNRCLKSPDAVVIKNGVEEITAIKLLRRCNCCASELLSIDPSNKLVAICIEDGYDYLTAVFGTIMAGYTFVPLDPAYPHLHKQKIINDNDISVCITDSNNLIDNTKCISPDKWGEKNEVICREGDNVYCIFTSGSTGRPKACRISQRNINNYLSWADRFYCRGNKECFAFFGSPEVDMTITTTLLPLVYGHKVIVYPNKPESIINIFNDPEITIVKATPSHLKLLRQSSLSKNIKILIVGGEQLTASLAYSIASKAGEGIEIYNEYGPTEATVGCVVYKYDSKDPFSVVPIGYPISNMNAYILDKNGDVCLPGITGEIVLEGESVISGYAGNVEKTKELFRKTDTGWRYYTGDLARLLADGRIIYEGRDDEQHKLNGFRVDLEEISSAAEDLEMIKDAHAMIVDGHLVLFCVIHNVDDASELEIRRKLFEKLPKHMMPSRICMIDSIPLARSGKIDSKRLSTIIKVESDPRSEKTILKKKDITEFIRKCWEQELGTRDFDNEDGFLEVGGNSISIASLRERIAACYEFVTVADLFCYPSVRTISDYIFEKSTNTEKRDHTAYRRNRSKEIAIIGVGLRVADAYDFAGLRTVFTEGINVGREIKGQRRTDESNRLKNLGIPSDHYRFGKTVSLERIDLFDPKYFNIGYDEACAMDVTHKLLMSVADDAFLDADFTKESLKGRNCAVILADSADVGFNEYLRKIYPNFSKNAVMNRVTSSIAGRIQYFYDLHGPAYMIDSACSSGSAAVYNACELIKDGICDMALVGGVNILDTVDYLDEEKSGVLSSHYFAAPFSNSAEGTSKGEGCICLLMEDYELAIQNNHYVYGKIRGAYMNNDGFSSSLTAPNGLMQESVIKNAWIDAGVEADDIDVIETHGTATRLGDMIEMQSLLNVTKNSIPGHCAISSAKAIFGHLDSISGLMGILKCLTTIYFGEVYPTNDWREPMDSYNLISSAFYIPNSVRSIDDGKVICGISSFGLSGTNVHIVIEGEVKAAVDRRYRTNQKPIRCWMPDEAEVVESKNYVGKQKDATAIVVNSIDDVIESLSGKVEELYGKDEIDIDQPLESIGFDSVSVIQLKIFIKGKFGIDADVFARSTLGDLALQIYQKVKVGVADLGGDKRQQPSVDTESHRDISSKYREIDELATETNNTSDSWYHLQVRNAIKEFAEKYIKKTSKSRSRMTREKLCWANGRFMTGYTRGLESLSYPILADHAHGSELVDIDGNHYIDFAMGFGSAFFGYNHPYIMEKVRQTITNKNILGALMDEPFETAERICEITGIERVSFCNSGTEAVMNLIRIARAVRDKNKIVVFSGAFHGTFDPVYVEKNRWGDTTVPAPRSIGTPLHYFDDIIMLPYGDDEALSYIGMQAEQLAAVVIEPVQSRHPSLQPREFIRNIRKITKEKGILLIFDEVITGFRCGYKGAQAYYGIEADLVSYGKVLGGGYPIGVFGGKAEYMDLIDHRGALTVYGSTDKWVSTGGTFNGHPASIAAAGAVLDLLKKDGDEIYARINKMTQYIADELNTYFANKNVDLYVEYFSSLFVFTSSSIMLLRILQYLMIYNNIYVWEGGTCFISSEHSWDQIYQFVNTVKVCVDSLKKYLPEKDMIITVVSEEIEGTDYAKLKKLVQKHSCIKEIAPLSMELKAILSRNITLRSKRMDCSVIKLVLKKSVDCEVLQKGIEQVINAHQHLRSGMSWRRLTQPVKIIFGHVKPRYNHYHFVDHIDHGYIKDIENRRKETGFVLEEAPLIAFDSFHGKEETILMITYYNSWFDGWSLDILLAQIQNYITNGEVKEEQMNWKKYVQWRSGEREKGKQYWKNNSYTVVDRVYEYSEEDNEIEYRIPIEEKLSVRVSEYCNAHNTSRASAYTYCLAKAIDRKTVMIDFSGRNASIEGITDAIGLFSGLAPVNTSDPKRINEEIESINSRPLPGLSEISHYTGIDPKNLISMTLFDTVVILNQDAGVKDSLADIIEDKSYVHVPRRFYIKLDKEILITAFENVMNRENVDRILNEFKKQVYSLK